MNSCFRVICLTLLISLFFRHASPAQSILAGETGTGITYVDIVPDTTILGIHNASAQSYTIDINNDGTDDFMLVACNCSGLGGGTPYSDIEPLNGSEIAFDHTDSCFSNTSTFVSSTNLAKPLFANDTVSNKLLWKNNTCSLSHYTFLMGSYSCSCGLFGAGSSYIGVRIFTASDTLYGWIRVKDVSTSSTTIEEYAYKKATGGIQNIGNSYISRVYPNPFSQNLYIDINPANTAFIELSIYDVLGNLWIDQELQNGKNVIDTKSLNHGMYFYQIKWEGKYIAGGKIVAM